MPAAVAGHSRPWGLRNELKAMTDTLTLAAPDDWHLHLRDTSALAATVPPSAARFARAIIMPNLKPPVTTVDRAAAYRDRILAARPTDSAFEPLMTLYLTQETAPEEIHRARECGFVQGVKLYPAGATTHSEAGVTDIARLAPVLEAMAAVDMPLLIHGEVTDPAVDIFDRETAFIDRVLAPLLDRHPGLRVVLEHITTRTAVTFVREAGRRVGATITPQHLLFNRNRLLAGGIRPHYYCLPILKRERDREALVEAATSGEPSFFLGTDSAPHPKHAKETACGCAGIFSAPAALELYAEAFEEAGALERLEGFASRFGPQFYGLPCNAREVTLVREPWTLPAEITFGAETVIPLRAGESVKWRLRTPL